MFMASATRLFLDCLHSLLREDYLHAGLGLSGYFGLTKAWDTFALAHRNITSIIQCMLSGGRAFQLDKTNRSLWEKDQEACLAQYYLLHVPGITSLNVWGNGAPLCF